MGHLTGVAGLCREIYIPYASVLLGTSRRMFLCMVKAERTPFRFECCISHLQLIRSVMFRLSVSGGSPAACECPVVG